MKHSDTINKLSEALCKAQKNFQTPNKKNFVKVSSRNAQFGYKYADYSEVLSCVKEALNNEGITILQPITSNVVETILLHESGEYISSETDIYIVPTPAKDSSGNIVNTYIRPQDYGSAVTYARRYALSAILALDSDEDDDANIANGNEVLESNRFSKPLYQPTKQSVQPKKIQQPQISKEARIDRIRRYIQYFLDHKKFENHAEIEAYLGVSLSDIPDNLDQVENKIKEFLERNK